MEIVLTQLGILGAFAVLMPALLWLRHRYPRPSPFPAKRPDPIETEALRLAREEVEELDWISGTGEKPEHVIRREAGEASRKREAERELVKKRMAEMVERGMLEAADKAAADLEALYPDRVVSTTREVKELHEEVVASSEALLEELERKLSITYPRPRKAKRPRTMSTGAK